MKPLIAPLALLLVLLIPSQALAASGSIVLDQPAPIHQGDSVTFTTSLSGDTKPNSTSYIWFYCQIGSTLDPNVRLPRDASFTTGPAGSTCYAILVYEWVYGGGKIGRQYVANTSFSVE